jgi:MerR family transcriptional regulator, thiopeptide resistance regulator
MRRGLTISQLAAFASVTIKTVRHYHRLGLIDEPRRDRSGYRRYVSADLLRLVQVRTLAEAGVPLAEIGAILDAAPDRFAADVADVERRLTARIKELVARRDMLHRLAAGNRLLLPDRACAILDRATDLGFHPDYVARVQEGSVLAKALIPEFDDYLAQIECALDDAKYIALIKRWWDAKAWKPDDPRVGELATAATDHLLANPKLLTILTDFLPKGDNRIRHQLLDDRRAEVAASWVRLSALIVARLHEAGIDIPGRVPVLRQRIG